MGTITDEEGRYIFADIGNGRYLIKAFMLGYLPAFSSSVVIANGDHYMGNLAMIQEIMELDEVIIEVAKPLYVQKMGGLTVNVQSSITSAGTTALEVLERSPGIIWTDKTAPFT